MKYTIRITLILLGLLSFHSGSAQIITTIGGGYIGNNVASNSLGIAPNGVVADKAGNIYISDDANYVIRKVNLSTGLMTIIAGNGSGGYGGAATLAELNNPEGLAIDSSGNIYVADANNNLIREINSSTGNITTVAGDVVDIGNHNGGYNGDGIAATTAKLYLPCSVAVDDSGNIFISDYINNRIRKVVHSTGIINTVAGNGATGSTSNGVPATSACVNYPTAITIDKSDNIYISSLYSIIEKVSVSNGFITTVAGISSIGGFSGDNGPATNAHIYDPGGVTLDMVGNIYIADTYNNRIRKVTPGGIISTVVGNGVPGYSGDGGSATSAEIQGPYSIASDIQGDLFIITLNEVIREVKVTNKDIYTVAGNGSPGYSGDGLAATNAQLYEPSGLNLDVSGNIYVADFGNSRIRKIDVSSGVISTFSGDSIAGYNGDKLLATNAELNGPNDLVFDAGKNLYIIDTYNERVRKINSNDTISTLAGTGVSGYNGNNCDADTAKLNDPYGIAVDSKGNVYIADTYNQIIRKVDISNGIITTIAGNGIAGYNGDKKKAINASLNNPQGVAVDAAGNIYIADFYNNRVREVDAVSGIITTIAGNGIAGYKGDNGLADSAELNEPSGVAIDLLGNLFVSDSYNNRIRMVNLGTGMIYTIAGDGISGFSGDGGIANLAELDYPENVAFDASDNMYIADNGNNRIRKVSAPLGIKELSSGCTSRGISKSLKRCFRFQLFRQP